MAALTRFMPRRGRGFWFGMAIDVLWSIVVLFIPMRMTGHEHVPKTGGVLLAFNHISFADPVSSTVFALVSGRVPRYLAKASLWRLPLVGSVMRSGRHVPVDRGTSRAGLALTGAQGAVERGECVAVYPEGTFTSDPDGWPMAGRSGVARAALASRAPVVPIAQWGTQRLLPRGSFLPRPLPRKRVDVVAGPAVDLSDLYDLEPTKEVLDKATARIMAAITDLLAGIRTG
ncbi:lysophospholipid acyltransferase family protein [Umezawaea sp. Da 62-37]|uniref:lysophospholipid acyltransferase family protein n=1 Tax=Umezawaea sp. Da 62-37 TaxID=3075927 RepID=UPI0028F6FE53|nr:lysophospholipid acyltransferase family protein [Umezawaea sp. Da 62-37]WNV92076.1 lysophospholipid acyltransferase family protein [Umezawaea sp. Da 62-37]